jgi:hypothetical protein
MERKKGRVGDEVGREGRRGGKEGRKFLRDRQGGGSGL